jgi:hypothetical protein
MDLLHHGPDTNLVDHDARHGHLMAAGERPEVTIEGLTGRGVVGTTTVAGKTREWL